MIVNWLIIEKVGCNNTECERQGDLDHCAVFLGKTLYSHSASLHPGAYMNTGEFNAGGNPVMD